MSGSTRAVSQRGEDDAAGAGLGEKQAHSGASGDFKTALLDDSPTRWSLDRKRFELCVQIVDIS